MTVEGTPLDKPASVNTTAWRGNYAQWASACIAFLGVGLISFQLWHAGHDVRESSARTLYLSTIEAGYRYPEFLEPNLENIKKDELTFARYKQYVGHLLYAYDEIFAVVDDPEWAKAFQLEFVDHLDYFCTTWPVGNVAQFYKETRKRLQALIVNAKRESCPLRDEWKMLSAPNYLPKG